MILAVRADNPTFKTVKLKHGLNVVLADRTKESTKKDSRNGLGKTTLIEVIQFCLGSGVKPNRGLLRQELQGWTFFLDMLIGGKAITAARNTSDHKRIILRGIDGLPLPVSYDQSTGQAFMTANDWNETLGVLMFRLPLAQARPKFSPTFRSLISYFIRRGPEAYNSPFEHHAKQQEWDKQVNNAFLLDLAWEDASEWQELKEKKSLLDDLKRASEVGLMDELAGTIGKLEAEKILLEQKVREQAESLRTFRVLPQYHEIESKADSITTSIHDLNNQNIEDRKLVSFYESGLVEEKEPEIGDVVRVYDEANVLMPEAVKKRLADVESFHKQLVQHRRDFLRSEIDRLRRIVSDRDKQIGMLTEERAGFLNVLQTHRALEEHTRLQQLHLATVQHLKELETQIVRIRKFEEGRSSLRIQQEMLQQRALLDYHDRRPRWEKAVEYFNSYSQSLYKAPGTLVIDVNKTGFKFNVEIQRSDSEGIGNMKVFCYDLTLARLWSSKPHKPGFLIHDSTMFDPVDSRQRALALELVQKESERYGFQYLCTLNSDMLPTSEFSKGFEIEPFVRLRLTDLTDDGGLLGIKF